MTITKVTQNETSLTLRDLIDGPVADGQVPVLSDGNFVGVDLPSASNGSSTGSSTSLSTEQGNTLIEDTGGSLYGLSLMDTAQYQFPVSATFNGGPTFNSSGATDPNSLFLGSFVAEAGTLTIEYSSVVTSGTAGLGISSTPFPTDIDAGDVVGSDIFSGSASSQRLNTTTQTRTYTVNIPTAGTYYIGVFNGGGGASDSHTVVVNDPNLMEQVTARTYSDGQTDKVIYFDDTNQPVELPSIPANWTLVDTTLLNYEDSNSIRRQWGVQAGDAVNTDVTVTFPQPMANTDYTLNLSKHLVNPTGFSDLSIVSLTTTGFTYRNINIALGTAGGDNVHWEIVGLRP